ncbi:lysine transporter LysE [Psychromonas sp. MB-3u-54]|uniref:LysE family translocator n=1 Tax=Psychromonas sp. MB-3u-54 TaxID=2058319 RepID=UPI000C335B45|nr:LysE family transporter [Psychromonas sp. MB-3u-54]PKH03519.1 lysine transporter LysE [Psychromonas sp. MB-3u-54]
MIAPYIDEFLMLSLVHFLAVIAPGPDFAVVIRQSISCGRKSALITSLGIGTGISIHVLYTLLGIGFIITQSETALMVAKIAGALYLSYIGFNMLLSKPQKQTDHQVVIDTDSNHHKGAFMLGFMTNLLNPKATLFFLAIFTAIVSTDTPIAVQSIYGLWIALTTALWFSLVSLFFSQQSVRTKFVRHGYIFERLMGGILLLFAAKLALML